MNAAIQLAGLSKRFGERVALNAISATIPTGGITGLVGPDGAGKSTLLRLLAGLLVPEAGEIRVLGLDPVREGDALRQRLGYMPQQFGLYEDLSVQENLSLYADLRGVLEPERTPTLARLLAFTDLARFTTRPAGLRPARHPGRAAARRARGRGRSHLPPRPLADGAGAGPGGHDGALEHRLSR